MQFYDPLTTDSPSGTAQGICQHIDNFCDSTPTSYSRLDKTRHANRGLEKLVGILINVTGDFEWDDTNYSTLPRGTGNLVEGQESYSFAAEYLKVHMIEVLQDSSPDVWHKLEPINSVDLGDLSPEEYFGQTSAGNPQTGMPEYYDIIGDSIILYPAPTSTAVTLTAGFRVWFQRTALLFTAVSTTAADTTEPGIPSPYHELPAYYAAIPYCMKYKRDLVAGYKALWNEGVKEMIDHFSFRNPNKRNVMTMKEVFFI